MWQYLLQLGLRVAQQTDPADQRELIRGAAQELLVARVNLWLAEAPPERSLQRNGERFLHPALSTEAMRRAFLTLMTQPDSAAAGGSLVVAAPIVAEQRLLGILQVQRDRDKPFTPSDVETIEALAGQVAIGLEAASRVASARRRAQEQAWVSTAILEVGRALQTTSSLDQVIQTATRLVPLLVGADWCAFLFRDKGDGLFTPRARYGLNPDQWSAVCTVSASTAGWPALEEICTSQTPVGVDPADGGSPLSLVGIGPFLLLPLLADAEVVAALLVDVGQRPLPPSLIGGDAPGAEWFEIARAIAQHASVAMENHQLRRSQQEEAYVSTALLQVVQATATRRDLGDVLGAIVRITPALVGVERCAILLWSSGQGTFYSAHSIGNPADPEHAPGLLRFRPGEFPLLDAVRRQGRPVGERLDALEGSTSDSTPLVRGMAVDWLGLPPGYSGVLQALPLTVRGSFLGAMLVAQGDAPSHVAERRQEILAGIAGQAAIAILNDRLDKEMARRERLAQEMKLARDIQRNLMPKRLPDYRAWQLAATCRPAREVGGDFFDVIELSEGQLGLVVADVADKGMPAALFMANARAMVRALASYNDSPAGVLELVNQSLLPDSHRGMFVTAFYAVLSTEDGAFAYCNAGHNPPFVWRHQVGDVERLRMGGTALGVLEKPRLEEHRAFLRSGDWLIIYTDGVTEAFSAESEAFYGEERLDAAIRANVTGRAQDLLEAIERSVADFVGDTPPSDDLTMLVVHCAEGEPGVPERTGAP